MKNILVIRTDRMGDVILSTPVLTALKNRYPDSHITMMVRNYTREIIENHPDVDQIILYDSPELSKFGTLFRYVRKQNFQIAILLHPKFRLALLLFLAQIPVRLSSGYRWYSFLFNRKVFEHRKTAEHHEVDLNLRMLKKIDVPFPHEVEFKFYIPESAIHSINNLLKNHNIPENHQLVIIHPGSGGSALDWPLKKFAGLCDRLSAMSDVTVILTGGSNEHEIVNVVLNNSKSQPIKLVGELTIKQLAALLKRSHLFISNSTGPLHLAVAVGTEVISFFCPVIPCLPSRWGPYNKLNDSVLMPQVPIRCKKCIGEKCEYYYCMDLISIDTVFSMAKKKLEIVK